MATGVHKLRHFGLGFSHEIVMLGNDRLLPAFLSSGQCALRKKSIGFRCHSLRDHAVSSLSFSPIHSGVSRSDKLLKGHAGHK